MKIYFDVLKKYKITLPVITILLLSSILTLIQTSLSKMLQITINNINNGYYLLGYGCLSIAMIVVSVTFSRYRAFNNERFNRKAQQELHNKVLKMPMSRLQEISISKVQTSFNQIPFIGDCIIDLPKFVLDSIVSLSIALVFMFNQNFWLALITVCEVIPIAWSLICFNKKITPMSKEKRETSNIQNSTFMRLFSFLTIKSFSKEVYENDKFNSVNNKFRNITLKKRYMTQNLWTVVRISYTVLDFTLIAYYFIIFIMHGTIDIAELLLFSSLQSNFINPFLGVNDFTNDVVDFKTQIDQVNEILNEPEDDDGKIKFKSFNYAIEFKDVGFKYYDSDEILRDINLVIPKGKHVGIYGESGAGKSTLINLLLRFFKVTQGSITLDGVNINEITHSSLRKHIGVVTQDVEIFSDMTILENIRYGFENCSESEVIEAAKKANAHEFISKLEKGYNSYVGNNGVKLSGGEKQRISLARLFLLDPDILILDEATSKLDNKSEDLIKESIDCLSVGKTVISIAHRFTTIEDSDILIGIKNHTIYETGTKESLLADKNSLFSKLYR